MRTSALAFAALFIALSGLACGGDPSPTTDSSTTSDADADTDADADADADTDADTDTDVDTESCEPGDAKAGAAMDCQAFCQPIVALGCSNVPDMPSCLDICGTYKASCAEWIDAVSVCVTAGSDSWICDDEGELDLQGACEPALECMVLCLDPEE